MVCPSTHARCGCGRASVGSSEPKPSRLSNHPSVALEGVAVRFAHRHAFERDLRVAGLTETEFGRNGAHARFAHGEFHVGITLDLDPSGADFHHAPLAGSKGRNIEGKKMGPLSPNFAAINFLA